MFYFGNTKRFIKGKTFFCTIDYHLSHKYHS